MQTLRASRTKLPRLMLMRVSSQIVTHAFLPEVYTSINALAVMLCGRVARCARRRYSAALSRVQHVELFSRYDTPPLACKRPTLVRRRQAEKNIRGTCTKCSSTPGWKTTPKHTGKSKLEVGIWKAPCIPASGS